MAQFYKRSDGYKLKHFDLYNLGRFHTKVARGTPFAKEHPGIYETFHTDVAWHIACSTWDVRAKPRHLCVKGSIYFRMFLFKWRSKCHRDAKAAIYYSTHFLPWPTPLPASHPRRVWPAFTRTASSATTRRCTTTSTTTSSGRSRRPRAGKGGLGSMKMYRKGMCTSPKCRSSQVPQVVPCPCLCPYPSLCPSPCPCPCPSGGNRRPRWHRVSFGCATRILVTGVFFYIYFFSFLFFFREEFTRSCDSGDGHYLLFDSSFRFSSPFPFRFSSFFQAMHSYCKRINGLVLHALHCSHLEEARPCLQARPSDDVCKLQAYVQCICAHTVVFRVCFVVHLSFWYFCKCFVAVWDFFSCFVAVVVILCHASLWFVLLLLIQMPVCLVVARASDKTNAIELPIFNKHHCFREIKKGTKFCFSFLWNDLHN